jgi:hypothetical protein
MGPALARWRGWDVAHLKVITIRISFYFPFSFSFCNLGRNHQQTFKKNRRHQRSLVSLVRSLVRSPVRNLVRNLVTSRER